jgi:hypothetical protein
MGRRFAIWLLPALVLPLAAGCTGKSGGGEFHSYQTSAKSGDGPADPNGSEKKSPAKVTDVQSADAKPSQTKESDGKNSTVVAMSRGTSSAATDSSAGKRPPSAPAGSTTASGSSTVATTGPKASQPSAPRKVELLVPNRTFRPEGDGGAVRVSYDDIDLLKVLNMDPVPADAAAYFPAWLKSLDGRRIRIRGFMYPTFQQTGVHAFGLARDNQICCFGRNPKIYDVFDVVLREGATTNYIPNRPFDVVGVFHIRPEVEDGKLYRLYEMDDAAVITK